MADVQFRQAFQFGDRPDVAVGQAVAGVERQAGLANHAGGPGERGEFSGSRLAVGGQGIRAGVEFDGIGAEFGRPVRLASDRDPKTG